MVEMGRREQIFMADLLSQNLEFLKNRSKTLEPKSVKMKLLGCPQKKNQKLSKKSGASINFSRFFFKKMRSNDR